MITQDELTTLRECKVWFDMLEKQFDFEPAESVIKISHPTQGVLADINMAETFAKLDALIARPAWFKIDDPDHPPPLDRPFIGCRINRMVHDKAVPDMTFLITGRHAEYSGGPASWTWNDGRGFYGIVLTHWSELQERPTD